MSMESLQGQLAGAPSAVAWDTTRLDVFAVGRDQGLWHWWRDEGGQWGGPEARGGSLPGEGVCAVARGRNRLDVFGVGGNRQLNHWAWNGASWSGPQPLGGNLPAETVSAVSWDSNRLDVFAPGQPGNQLFHWSWNGGNWSGPEARGGVMNAEGVSAVSWGPNRLDVFGVEAGTGQLLHWSWDGAWHDNEKRGGMMNAESVSAVSWGPNRLDVFGVEAGSGHLLHWSWDGARWNGPESLGGSMGVEGVSAVSSGPNRLTVFGIEAGSGQLLRWTWNGASWANAVRISPDSNLPTGDVSGVARGASQVDVFARASDNSLRHWPGGTASAPSDGWKNWAGTFGVPKLKGHCHPGSLEELVAIVQDAERGGRRVRAVGSSWSLSDVAMTPDYLVETNQFNRLLTHVVGPGGVLDPAVAGRKFIHAEAGLKLQDFNAILDARGLAVFTMGGSDGQSLAGALSTSVHGPDFDRGPLPDTVRAIHLVGPGGIQHWIEPAQGITNRAALQARLNLPPGNVHYDDDWFNSVLVSVGTLGIIYSLIIEVRDQYDLLQTCKRLPWPEVRRLLALPDSSPESPFRSPTRCVQVAIDPAPPHGSTLITREEGGATAAIQSDGSDPLGMFCQGFVLDIVVNAIDWAVAVPIFGPLLAASPLLAPLIPILAAGPLVFLAALRAQGPGAIGDFIAMALDRDPGMVAHVTKTMTDRALPETAAGVPKRGFAHCIMAGPNPSECAARGLSLEVAFDATTQSHLRYMDEAVTILDTARRQGLALGGWLSMRFVGRSRAYLSPQKSARTCMVEATGLRGLRSSAVILGRLEAAGRSHGGIQHWGMFSDLTRADVEGAYPRLKTWRQIRWNLTNGGKLHTFDNAFSERVGLSAAP